MRHFRAITLILAVVLGFGACGSGSGDGTATETDDAGSASSSFRGTGGIEGSEAGSSEVKRPRPGEYVYSFFGRGETSVPAGTELREQISQSGDGYTIEITNNRNENTRRVELRWESDHVLQMSNETVIGGQRRTCRYDPPLEILRVPIQAEAFETQASEGEFCEDTVDIGVLGREEIEDANERKWSVWIIEVQLVSGEDATTETQWFSPELGRPIRIETRSAGPNATNRTGQLLKKHPG